MRRTALLALLAALLASPAQADQPGTGAGTGAGEASGPTDAVAAGDAEMLAGDYAGALAAYDERVAAGEQSASLHFNMGLASAHLDRLGWAVYHFTQAHYLDPGADDVADSLALLDAELRQQRRDIQAGAAMTRGASESITWLGIFTAVSPRVVDVVLLGAIWLGFGLLLVRRRLPTGGVRDAAFVAALLALVLAVGAAAYRVGGRITRDEVVPGVVVTSNPMLYEGPDRAARRAADPDLFEGALVRVTDEREEWVGVELANGRSGWLAQGALQRVDVPAR